MNSSSFVSENQSQYVKSYKMKTGEFPVNKSISHKLIDDLTAAVEKLQFLILFEMLAYKKLLRMYLLSFWYANETHFPCIP